MNIEKEKLKYKVYEGTLVLDFLEVVLFVGVIEGIENYDDEFYLSTLKSKGYMEKEDNILVSPLIGFILLKGSLPTKEYKRLVKIWNLNQLTKAK